MVQCAKKSINIMLHNYRMKDENHINNSINSEKTFAKIQHHFMINMQQNSRDGTPQSKVMHENCPANIIHNGAKSDRFSSRTQNRTNMPLLPPLFNIILEVLAGAGRQKKKTTNSEGNK